MTGQQLSEALRAGRYVYGTAIVACSPRWPALAKGLGLDFAFIDTEHVALDRNPLSWMCHAYHAAGVAPIVRVPSPTHHEATKAVDGGASGIIGPYVETPEQVRELVGAVKYRPMRGQKLQRILDGEERMEPQLAGYIKKSNANHVLIVNIESVPAMDALDDICAVDGLDAVLIGPHDLSTSMGIPEQYEHPDFIAAIDTIITTARRHGVGAGIHITFPEKLDYEIRWAKLGANLIVHSSDLIGFRSAMVRELGALRGALGSDAVAPRPDSTGDHI